MTKSRAADEKSSLSCGTAKEPLPIAKMAAMGGMSDLAIKQKMQLNYFTLFLKATCYFVVILQLHTRTTRQLSFFRNRKKLYQRPQHTYTQTRPRLDNAIHWMNPYPLERALCSFLHYLSFG